MLVKYSLVLIAMYIAMKNVTVICNGENWQSGPVSVSCQYRVRMPLQGFVDRVDQSGLAISLPNSIQLQVTMTAVVIASQICEPRAQGLAMLKTLNRANLCPKFFQHSYGLPERDEVKQNGYPITTHQHPIASHYDCSRDC